MIQQREPKLLEIVLATASPRGFTTAIVPVEGLYDIVGFVEKVLMDLAGTTPGTGYDQLNCTGPITLTSTTTRLEVSPAGGFFPAPGQSFTLITTTDALTGNFGVVQLPTLPQGLSWTQQKTADSFSISLAGSIAADFDEDGAVDGDDLTRWQAGYGTGTVHMQGNADGTAMSMAAIFSFRSDPAVGG